MSYNSKQRAALDECIREYESLKHLPGQTSLFSDYEVMTKRDRFGFPYEVKVPVLQSSKFKRRSY